MATGVGRISLPLARWGGSRPPPVAGSIFFFFFFYFFFFSLEKSLERVVGGGVCSSEVGDGRRWVVASG
jgi:hypothetical protein